MQSARSHHNGTCPHMYLAGLGLQNIVIYKLQPGVGLVEIILESGYYWIRVAAVWGFGWVILRTDRAAARPE